MILYTTGCPKCKVLEKKLNEKGVSYEVVDDVDKLVEKGFMSVPVLELDDGEILQFTEAVKHVNGI